MKSLSFIFIRLGVGISMLGHGLVRIPKISNFSSGMVDSFNGSYLPEFIIVPFSLVLPFLEFLLGLMLLLGWHTRMAGILGGVLMLFLMFGTAMIENWGALPSQMIHLLFFIFVYEFNDKNAWALDSIFSKK
ncbi:DoxX family membrane protein [Cyclobacterium plantarum]|uniref:DoxX family membrane protein n=1 Tax=Cyclobacterium plantarum TaxID=2716263 RepID=A0ABX0HCK6_9BACT|nr:DoxX family membrane protein [Cyclobacterium plantarum]NHE58151.1 DoxX family membrane protein [Cyclobacterium plantarum]